MAIIFTAHKWEASQLVKHLALDKSSFSNQYESKKHKLVVTGIGKEKAFKSIEKMPRKIWRANHFINFGLAGAPKIYPVGTLYQIERITDAESEESFVLSETPFDSIPIATLTTFSKPVSAENPMAPKNSLVDMEGSTIAATARKYNVLDKFTYLKIVLDNFSPIKPTKEEVEQLISPHIDLIVKFIHSTE